MMETVEPPLDPQERHGPDEGPIVMPRVAGLNRGQIWVSADFDAPLPDEFGLGPDSAPPDTHSGGGGNDGSKRD